MSEGMPENSTFDPLTYTKSQPRNYDEKHAMRAFPEKGLKAMADHREREQALRKDSPSVGPIEGLLAAEQADDQVLGNGAAEMRAQFDARREIARQEQWRIDQERLRTEARQRIEAVRWGVVHHHKEPAEVVKVVRSNAPGMARHALKMAQHQVKRWRRPRP